MTSQFEILCLKADQCIEEASKTQDNGDLLAQAATYYLQASELAPLEIHPYLGLAYLAYVSDHHATAMGLLLQAQALEPFNLEIEKMLKEFEQPRSEKRLANLRQKKIRALASKNEQSASKNPALTRLFQPIQGRYDEPKSLFQAVQTRFNVTLSKEDTVCLFQSMQGHSTAEDLTTALQNIKGILAKIKPEFGQNPFDFAKTLATHDAASTQSPNALGNDALDLKGFFQNPQQLYQAIQSRFGVALTKAKATALFCLFEHGQLEPSRALTSEDISKIQQVLGELGLLTKTALDNQQELGKYGILTQTALTKLLQTLKK